LYAESFAPWCEKARWALDHHGISYHSVEHTPLLGELGLRWAARRPFGPATVPLLVSDGLRLTDSFEIARWAEGVGHGTPLFPEDRARDAGSQDHAATWKLVFARPCSHAIRSIMPPPSRGVT
jgi:glutathione S-transferase